MNATLSLQLIGTPEMRLGSTRLCFQRRRSLALLAGLSLSQAPDFESRLALERVLFLSDAPFSLR
jgi:hypothetical protein